jgi:hypothetical protein
MRQRLLLAGLFLLAAVVLPAALSSAEITKGPLAPGKNVPGSFHPYNVTARVIPPEEMEQVEEDEDRDKKEKEKEKDKTKKEPYTSKGKYHCLVTEYDLDPVVLLFARDLEENEAFLDLVKKLEDACTKHRLGRLRAFVVFLPDKLTNVSAQDDERGEAVKKIEKIQAALKLSNVVLTLAAKGDVAKYELDPSAALTAVLYRNLRIQASRTVSRDELDKADGPAVKALLADVTDKLLPKR